MKLLRGHSADLASYLFQSLLVTYLVLLLIEQLWEGIVSVYLNLNYLLIGIIVMGIVDLLSERPERTPLFHMPRENKWDGLFALFLGAVGFIIIKIKTGGLGGLSWVISLIAGFLIVLLSFLILEENDER